MHYGKRRGIGTAARRLGVLLVEAKSWWPEQRSLLLEEWCRSQRKGRIVSIEDGEVFTTTMTLSALSIAAALLAGC